MKYELRITYCIPRKKESALGNCGIHKSHVKGQTIAQCHKAIDAMIATDVNVMYILITKEV